MPFTMAQFLEIAGVISWVTALLALVANLKLMHLASSAPIQFHQYPTLMIANSLNLILFSAIHAIIQPIISIEKTVVYVFTASNLTKLPKLGMRLLLGAYGATYCSSLLLCGVMFIYRYNTVCRKTTTGTAHFFDSTRKMSIWFIGIIGIGLYWGGCIFFVARDTPYVDSIISSALNDYYGKNISDVTYVAAVYQINNNGTMSNNTPLIVMGVSFMFIIAASMLTTIFCVWKIARRSRTAVSPAGIETLQKQLWEAQMAQASIPFTLVFIPIITILALPLANLDGNVAFSVVSILVSIYPVLDPLALMMFITVFRQRLLGTKPNYSQTP